MPLISTLYNDFVLFECTAVIVPNPGDWVDLWNMTYGSSASGSAPNQAVVIINTINKTNIYCGGRWNSAMGFNNGIPSALSSAPYNSNVDCSNYEAIALLVFDAGTHSWTIS